MILCTCLANLNRFLYRNYVFKSQIPLNFVFLREAAKKSYFLSGRATKSGEAKRVCH